MSQYYLASDQGPLGPFDISQLAQRHISPGDLVWCNGMTEWAEAKTIEGLKPLFETATVPPAFDRRQYNDAYAKTPAAPAPEYVYPDDEECPPTYRWLAIIAFLGIVPCAIIALIKSVMVSRLWEEGNREGARKQSRATLVWSLISIIIGLPISIYMMFFSEGSGLFQSYQEIIQSLI